LSQLTKSLLIFALGFILGYNVTSRVQKLQETKSPSCLPSADGGSCILFNDIQKMMQDDPDPAPSRAQGFDIGNSDEGQA